MNVVLFIVFLESSLLLLIDLLRLEHIATYPIGQKWPRYTTLLRKIKEDLYYKHAVFIG